MPLPLSLLLACASGALLYAAYPPLGLSLLAIPAIALLDASVGTRARRGLLAGMACGLTFFLPLLSWTAIAVDEILPWLALALFESLYFALLGALWSRMPRRRGDLFLRAGAFTGVEVLRATVPFGGFPWGLLAFSQVDSPLLRTAPFVSATGVTFLTALAGVALSRSLARIRAGRPSGAGGLIMIAACLGLALALPLPTRGEDSVRIGWVQGGPATAGEDRALSVTRHHREETEELLSRVGDLDLIVWPESASDRDVRVNTEAHDELSAASEAAGVPILLGTQSYVDDGRYNEYLAWSGGKVIDGYAKSRPVPFGEYIPWRPFFSKLSAATELISTDMLPGEGPATLRVNAGDRELVLATPICFEIAIDQVMRDAIKDGAQAIIVPVNSASFGQSAESKQQLDQTIFRAVEFGRSAIQVSTVGHSAVIQPNGAVTELSPTWEPASGAAHISLRTGLTPAARLGKAITVLALISLGAACIRALRSERPS